MSTSPDINTHRVRSRITNRIEDPRPKTVDVQSIVTELVEAVQSHLDSNDGDVTEGEAIDATWHVIEQEEPYLEMSHTERLYTVGFLFTNYGVSPTWLTEDRRVSHAEHWADITNTLCEYALYEVVNALVTGKLSEKPHTIGEFNDGRRDAQRVDFSDDLRTAPLTNADVHNWIAVLASDVSTRLANHEEVPRDERTDVQTGLTDSEAETEGEAIYDVIEEEAREELFTGDLITTASFLDALEDLYAMDGRESIESEQLAEASAAGWHDAITTGILWQAMAAAIRIHRETFQDEFKKNLDR